ncbi:MAG TPA: biotin/lipoyl-binding protein, partial [Thermoanaerobaculia bacterium]|nr:biotin/lipoyl-binding protein [Thermoanaerobaculia bacterium]
MKRLPLLVLLTLAVIGCAKKETVPTTTSAPPPLPADVQKVSAAVTATTATTATGQVASAAGDTIVATGEFVAPVRSELAAKIPGRVAKVYVDEGARVSRGQALLELETDYPRLNLQRAEADAA